MERPARISLLSIPLFAVLPLAASCVQPSVVDVSDKPCPCATGYVCDTATDRCVRSGSGGGGDGGAAGDGGAGSDGAVAGDGGAGVDGGAAGDRIELEAEDGTVEPPMQTATDAAASGGSYVTVDAATAAATDAAPATGKVTFSFDVTTDGDYRVWARTITVLDTGDSFWVRMDGGTWVKWNGLGPFATYDWAEVIDADAAVAETHHDFPLTAGAHTFDVAYREIGAQLDKILITSDLAFVPAG